MTTLMQPSCCAGGNRAQALEPSHGSISPTTSTVDRRCRYIHGSTPTTTGLLRPALPLCEAADKCHEEGKQRTYQSGEPASLKLRRSAEPTSQWLERYASSFDTVEVNNTFYRLPEAATFALALSDTVTLRDGGEGKPLNAGSYDHRTLANWAAPNRRTDDGEAAGSRVRQNDPDAVATENAMTLKNQVQQMSLRSG